MSRDWNDEHCSTCAKYFEDCKCPIAQPKYFVPTSLKNVPELAEAVQNGQAVWNEPIDPAACEDCGMIKCACDGDLRNESLDKEQGL